MRPMSHAAHRRCSDFADPRPVLLGLAVLALLASLALLTAHRLGGPYHGRAASLMMLDAREDQHSNHANPHATQPPLEPADHVHGIAPAQIPHDTQTPTHAHTAQQDEPGLQFNGRPLRKVRQVQMRVTAYSPDEQSCGEWADGWTASGYSVWTNGMRLVAADTDKLPFGSIVSVPGYYDGIPVPVLDRGGAIKGNRLDVLYPTHERALQWGVQNITVTIYEYAD